MSQQRFVILAFIVGSILVGLAIQAAAVDALQLMAMSDDRLLGGLVSTSTLLSVIGTAISFFGLIRNRNAVKFTGEVINELMKVTWPTRDETVSATTTVVFTTLFVAVLLGLYDLLWKNVADVFLFNQG